MFLKKGESKQINFIIHPDDLKFYNSDLEFTAEPGQFEVFIGNSSQTNLKANFELK